MYATAYVARIFETFPKIHEDIQNVHASCSLIHLHICITPSLIITYSVINFLSHKDNPLTKITTFAIDRSPT
jgi:hypothetical protein